MAKNDGTDSNRGWKLGKKSDKRESRLELEEIEAPPPKPKKKFRKPDPAMRESLSSSPSPDIEEEDGDDNEGAPIGRSLEEDKRRRERRKQHEQKKKKPAPFYQNPLFIFAYTILLCGYFTWLLYPRLGNDETPDTTLTSLDFTPGVTVVHYFIKQDELVDSVREPASYSESLGVREGRFLVAMGVCLAETGEYFSKQANAGRIPPMPDIPAIDTVPPPGDLEERGIAEYHKLEVYDSLVRLSIDIGKRISAGEVSGSDIRKAGYYLQFRGRSLLDTTVEDSALRKALGVEGATVQDMSNNNAELGFFEDTLREVLPQTVLIQILATHSQYFE